jgi:hypothetical protein
MKKTCERDAVVEFLKREHDFWYCVYHGVCKNSFIDSFSRKII